MGLRNSAWVGAAVAVVGVLLAFRQFSWFRGGSATAEAQPVVMGKNNTVLFIFGSELGLSNVHVATAMSLLKRYPDVDVHVASFVKSKKRLDRVANSSAGAPPPRLTFHAIEAPDTGTAMAQRGFRLEHAIHAPGRKGFAPLCNLIQLCLSPWPTDTYFDIYQQLRAVIDQVDPAVVVLEVVMRPAVDATRDANRLHVVVTPSTIADVVSIEQPMGQIFWKYPAMGSGFSFPVPWRNIPENVYLVARFIYCVVFTPDLAETRRQLREKGIRMDTMGKHRDDVVWISQELEGAAVPVAVMPPNFMRVGPITISLAPAAEQDPELAAWMARAPTVLVNLGNSVHYSEGQARVMATALAAVLDRLPGVQVLWKMRKAEVKYPDEVVTEPLRRYLARDRIRLPLWFAADPTSLLESGHIVLSVHHGGANVYHEAVSSGVPHVILPLWADLYNYAVMAEDHGIGIWASKRTAPDWTAEEISEAIIKVLSEDDPAAIAMREKAKMLGAKARQRPGRDHAADIVAGLAAKGH